MYYQKKKNGSMVLGVILGSAVASVLTMLFAPKSGKEVRHDISERADNAMKMTKETGERILENAKEVSTDIQNKANQLLNITKDYSAGKYSGPKESFMAEYNKIKSAINAAISVYQSNQEEVKSTEEMVEDIFSDFEDDTTPKNEGMGRRS